VSDDGGGIGDIDFGNGGGGSIHVGNGDTDVGIIRLVTRPNTFPMATVQQMHR
jgi:hypothetical protein